MKNKINILICLIFTSIFFVSCTKEIKVVDQESGYEVTGPIFSEKNLIEIEVVTQHKSFWLKKDGKLIQENGKYIGDEKLYIENRTIKNTNSVFIIMDPWSDMDSDFLNKRHSIVMNETILPLVEELIKNEFEIIIFTNDCQRRNREFNCKIGSLSEIENTYKNVNVFYHEDWVEPSLFSTFLETNNIKNLIYMGFNTNQCIINRPVGMIPMNLENSKFNYYIIPEATAAIEFGEGWENNEARDYTVDLISSWLGEVLPLKELMSNF